MAKKVRTDWLMFALAAGLALFGAIMVYSASAMIALKESGSQFTYFFKQFGFTVAGIAVMYIVSRVDYRKYQNPYFVYGLIALTVVLLLAVFAFPPINGARRWIRFAGFSLQPSELTKIALPVFLAYFLTKNEKSVGELRETVLPCVAGLVLLGGLVFMEKDLGTTIVLCTVFSASISRPARGFCYSLGSGVNGGGRNRRDRICPWRVARLMAFVDPFKYADDEGYQVVQSLYAIGSGGISAKGLPRASKSFLSPLSLFGFYLFGGRERARLSARWRSYCLRPVALAGNARRDEAPKVRNASRHRYYPGIIVQRC